MPSTRSAVIGGVLAVVLAVVLGLPGAAGAEPSVPDANLRQATLSVETSKAALKLDDTKATLDLDLSKAVVPLETEETDGRQVTVRLSADVLFDFGKATLTGNARRRIAALAPRLRGTNGVVKVSGHSDSVGSPAYNLALSKARAEAVRSELARLLTGTGVRIEATGYGETRPVAPNEIGDRDNPEGRAKNRRVDITFQKA